MKVILLHLWNAISVLVRKIIITYFCLTESGGTTKEVVVMATEEQPLIK